MRILLIAVMFGITLTSAGSFAQEKKNMPMKDARWRKCL